ncbi:hypothetical protein [uncultured Jatrophihabitans sp.]|uniref:hypothetical protein n=1 Tax=uncultured Jatrophihabitans sp. TaxID=1610747 RepID=UPI0035C9D442
MIRVRAATRDGTVTAWLDQLGQVANWRHTKNNPGGPTSAEFDFIAQPDLRHPCMQGGAMLDAYSGTKRVWRGRLEQPIPGLPWQCTGTGAAALAKDYQAHATSGNIYASMNTTVDTAIADGLPWTRPATLLNPIGAGDSLSASIDGLLGSIVQQGQYWNLDNDSRVTTSTTPPPVTLLLAATDLPARTLDGYATAIAYSYTDGSNTFHNITYATAALRARYGTIMDSVDLSSLGALTSAQALSVAQALLARQAANGLPWTSGFTILPGQLYTLGGATITDLATLDANITIRVIDLTPGDGFTPTFDVPIGQLDYDDTTGQATLTPYAVADDSLLASIARTKHLAGL